MDDQILEAIAADYNLGTDPRIDGPAQRGFLGRVWPVRTGRGRWAVKHVFYGQVEADESPNAAFVEAAVAAGIDAPLPIRRRDGPLLTEVDGRQYRVYTWVDIAEPDPLLDPAEVGSLVARLHQVEFRRDDEPVDEWYAAPIGRTRWRELCAVLGKRGTPYAAALETYLPELTALEDLLEVPRDVQVCHRDLWADNVRRGSNGRLCVIDWENAGSADPSHELGMTLFEYARNDVEVRAGAFLEAYRAAGGPGWIHGPGSFTMVIAQLAHIGELAFRCWLTADDPAERERWQSSMDEFLGEPLTVTWVDAVIGIAAGLDARSGGR